MTAKSVPDHHQAVRPRLRAPGLARPAEHLAHIGAALVAREGGEALAHRIEALDRIGRPVGRPYAVLVVDIDRIGAGGALGHGIDLPRLRARIVASDRAAIPEAHPQQAFAVRPDAPRADTPARRIDHRDGAARAIDPADRVARQSPEPDVSR